MKKILLIVFLIMSGRLLFADIVMPPYLMSVSVNSVYVMVECTTTDSVTVNYGTTPSFGLIAKTESYKVTTASPVTYVHRIRLTGMNADTPYYYRAVHGNSTSTTSSFLTAVNPGVPFRFTWMADVRTNTSPHDQINALMLQRNPRFSMYGGDYCETGTYDSWKNEFFRTNELNILSKVPVFAVPGNHEGWGVLTQSFLQSPQSASGTQDYYSFDYGDMHVLALNNQISYSVGSPQYIFAQSDLAASNKPWKVVMCHNPGYCSGGHGEDAGMITMAQNVFIPNHVDIVFSGHSHFYQHNYVSGIHYMVIGTAGAPLYDPVAAPYVLLSVKDYNYGVVDVTPSYFNVVVYNNVNTKLDSIRLIKTTNIKYENSFVQDFELLQNYPNPFNPGTVISFSIPENSKNKMDNFTSLQVFDLDGKLVADLLEKNLMPGKYEVPFDASGLSSGIYVYRLSLKGYSMSKRMIFVK